MSTLGSYMNACGLTEAASFAEGGVMYSEPEIRLAEELTRRGFSFEQQKRVPRGKTSAVLDFWVEDALAVEVDGKEFHGSWEHSARDAQRNIDLHSEHGIFTLRIPAWRVMRDVEAVVCRIAFRLSEFGFRREKPSVERAA